MLSQTSITLCIIQSYKIGMLYTSRESWFFIFHDYDMVLNWARIDFDLATECLIILLFLYGGWPKWIELDIFAEFTLVSLFFSDERFRYLFLEAYQRKPQHFELSYGLIIETNRTLSYLTRSEVECSILCTRNNECTGFNYISINSTCGLLELVSVVLP